MEKQIRCAIYTRKSCEDKIKKEFSSIEAQRLSGENYAASQGWEIIEEKYDDNGFSGGNIQRPGLKKLLRDIEKGKIDCVIAYKVDRLSRSLLDFERIMNKFDKYKVT